MPLSQSRANDFDKSSNLKYTHAQQQKEHSGDLFFEFLIGIDGAKIAGDLLRGRCCWPTNDIRIISQHEGGTKVVSAWSKLNACPSSIKQMGKARLQLCDADCCQFIAFVVEQLTGKDYAAGFQYELEAQAVLIVGREAS